MVLVSIAWTTWLIVLNIAPNATANYLMDTAEFDNGTFWLILDPELKFAISACVGLGFALLGYLYAFAQTTFLRNSRQWFQGISITRVFPNVSSRSGSRTLSSWSNLTRFDGLNRKLWNFWLKVVDLVFQTITLHQILESGFPPVLCYSYAALVVANSICYALIVMNPTKLSAFGEVLVDTLFDMVMTVVAPIILLAYSYYNFQFDRGLARFYLKTANASQLERKARLMADPSEVTLFLLNFNALRIQTVSSLVVRISMNLCFCYRLKRVIEVQMARRQQDRARADPQTRSTNSQIRRAAEQRTVPKWLAAPFLAFGGFLIVYTWLCASLSRDMCASFRECVAHAHRILNDGRCPCIALIDIDKAPPSYEVWTKPVDMTQTVALLAASGDIQVLQLINRRLVQFPEELRACRNLRHMHIEGKPGSTNLVSLTDAMFSRMRVLMTIHLAMHPSLTALPSFEGLTNLKTLSLVLLTSLPQIPSFHPLHANLARLELLMLQSLEQVPDIKMLTKLLYLTLQDVPACCNGYLQTSCNQSQLLCNSRSCVAAEIGDAYQEVNHQILQRFRSSVCKWYTNGPDRFNGPSKADIDACGGVLYRQCNVSDSYRDGQLTQVGMCYNDRMQAIACIGWPFVSECRRDQIRRHVGPQCDPVEEKWLGCE
uniref:WLGC domain-containing protein n=1 Tax=Globisporangium ultimum (strain ATCC 200006 / CBS 805.95 / DAOM BR144) TaxID=431595 RepID=K3X7X6_GLOUD